MLTLIQLPSFAGAGFTFQNKPISPKCIAHLMNKSVYNKHAHIDLSRCSGQGATYVTYDVITTLDPNLDQNITPFSDYSIIGNNANKFLLSFGQWTGGSGLFSSVLLVQKYGNEIRLEKVLSFGDRCNGGSSKSGEWQYSVHLTPIDILDRASIKKNSSIHFDDLDSSATSCYGSAYYQFDYKTGASKLLFARLNHQGRASKTSEKTYRHQMCFDKVYRSYVSSGAKKVKQSELNEFYKEFSRSCLSSKGKQPSDRQKRIVQMVKFMTRVGHVPLM